MVTAETVEMRRNQHHEPMVLPLDVVLGESQAVSELPDDEVRKLAASRLVPAQDQRLSQLLDKQEEGILTEQERSELLTLMPVSSL